MSKEGISIARELQRKYSNAEKVIMQADRNYFNSLSASNKIRLATYLANICFEIAANNGRKSLRNFWDAIEFGRKEKIKNYQKIIRWMRRKQRKSL